MTYPLLLLAMLVVQAEPPPEPGPAGPAFVEPEVGMSTTIFTVKGRRWSGELTVVTPSYVELSLEGEDGVRIKRESIRRVLAPSLAEPEVPFGELRSGPGPDVRVVQVDGRVHRAFLLREDASTLGLALPDGTTIDVPQGEVVAVIHLYQPRRPADVRQRYLEAPSALLPEGGSVTFGLTELAHLTAVLGIGPYFTLSAGTLLPVGYASDYGGNGQVALRGGYRLGESWSLAAGVHASFTESGRTTGFLSATATYSRPSLDVTLHAGPTFPGLGLLGDLPSFGDVGVAACATLRINRTALLVSETWISTSTGDLLTLAAVRFQVRRAILDAGAGATASHPFLWLGITMEAWP